MSESARADISSNKETAVNSNNIKTPFAHYLTLVLFISILTVSFSFAIYPLLSASQIFMAKGREGLYLALRNYPYYNGVGIVWRLAMRLLRDIRIFWVNVILRQVIISGLCIWGIAALSKGKKNVIAALYALAAFFAIYILQFIYVIVDMSMSPQNAQHIGAYLGGFFRDYHTHIFMFFLLACILCAIFLASGFRAVRYKEKAVVKQVSGLGGWMVIGIIRIFGIAFNYALIILLALLTSLGVKGLIGFGNNMLFTYFQWDLVLMAVFICAFSVVVIVKLFGRKRSFRPLGVAFESVNLFMNFFFLLNLVGMIIYVGAMPENMLTVLASQIIAMVWSAAFIAYYVHSDRVKNTFVK